MQTPLKKQAPIYAINQFTPFISSLQRTKLNFQINQEKLSIGTKIKAPNINSLRSSEYSCQSGGIFNKLIKKQGIGSPNCNQIKQEMETLIQQILESSSVCQIGHKVVKVDEISTREIHEGYYCEHKKQWSYKKQEDMFLEGNQNKNCNLLQSLKSTAQKQFKQDTRKQIQAGDYLLSSSLLPKQVLQAYSKQQKVSQKPHFFQGYLSNIDCLYYVVQKFLYLHAPKDFHSSLSKLIDQQNQSTCIQLSDILYNIVQTGIKVSQILPKGEDQKRKQNLNSLDCQKQVIIICFPFSIELYFVDLSVNDKQNKSNTTQNLVYRPLGKLNLKYFLPDCSHPKNIYMTNSSIFYIADNQYHCINQLQLCTGTIKKIRTQSFKGIIKQPSSYHKEQKDTKISSHLIKKLSNNILWPSTNSWFSNVASRYMSDVRTIKFEGSLQGQLMLSFMQIKLKDTVKSLLGSNIINAKKFVKIFAKQKHHWISYQIQRLQEDGDDILQVKLIEAQKEEKGIKFVVRFVIWNQLRKTITVIDEFLKTQNSTNNTKNQFNRQKSNKICSVQCNNANWLQNRIIMPNLTKDITDHLYFGIQQKESKKTKLYKISLSLPLTLQKQQRRDASTQITRYFLSKSKQFLSDEHMCWETNLSGTCQEFLYIVKNSLTISTDLGYLRLLPIRDCQCIYSIIHKELVKPQNLPISIENLYQNLIDYDNHRNKTKIVKNELQSLWKIVKVMTNLIIIHSGKLGMDERNIMLVWGSEQQQQNVGIQSVNYQINCSGESENVRKVCLRLVLHILQNFNHIINNIEIQHMNSSKMATQLKINKNPFITNSSNIKLSSQSQQQNQQQNSYLNLRTNKHYSRNKSHQLILIMLRFGICYAIACIVKQVWDIDVRQVKVENVRHVLQNLDCLEQLCETVAKQGYIDLMPFYNMQCSNNKASSPVSTVAQGQTYQIHQNPLLNKITQITQISQILSNTFNRRTPFKIIYKQLQHNRNKHDQQLFKQFIQDYDANLLSCWHKTIPLFLGRDQIINTANGCIVRKRSLAYWLGLVQMVLGVSNQNKVLRIVCQYVGNWKIVRQSAVNVNSSASIQSATEYLMSADSIRRQKTIVLMPNYLLSYLNKHKNITYSDLHLMQRSFFTSSTSQPTSTTNLRSSASNINTQYEQHNSWKHPQIGQFNHQIKHADNDGSNNEQIYSHVQQQSSSSQPMIMKSVCHRLDAKEKSVGVDLMQAIKK